MLYRFGRFELDIDRFELKEDDTLVPVEPQVLDILRVLIVHRDRLVSRDELIDRVWDGRIVSDATVSTRINAARRAVGDSGDKQEMIKTVTGRGFRFVAQVEEIPTNSAPAPADVQSREQIKHDVQFCRSADGTGIAYSVSGQGPVVVKAGHWLTHLEQDWQSPIWGPLFNEICMQNTLVRYDQRGNGLSDWDTPSFLFDDFVADIEAVVAATGIDRFALYGMSQGAPIAIAYATRYPERVTCLVLQGGFARGRLAGASVGEREQAEAYLTLMAHGWGQEGSQFLQAFGSIYIPDGTKEQLSWLAQLQRNTTNAANAVAMRKTFDMFDVTALLSKVTVPTLVLHARNDAVHPFEQGRKIATTIPAARFIPLESRNHVMLEHDPAWPIFIDAVTGFLAQHDQDASLRKTDPSQA